MRRGLTLGVHVQNKQPSFSTSCRGAMLPLAILVPPTLVAGVAGTWWAGQVVATRQLGATTEPPRGTFAGSVAGVAGAIGTWRGLGATVYPAFDAMSTTPVKIESFKDFTRSAGPPAIARCGGVLACFFVAGASKTATDVWMGTQKKPIAKA